MVEQPRKARGPQVKQEFEEHGFSLDEVKEWKTQLEKVVSDHPILAAGVAVGVGVLIARLIQRASDDDFPRRKSRLSGVLGSEVGRAVMGSLATMAAAKLQETLLADLPGHEEDAETPRRPARKRASKQARASGQKRTRARPPRKRAVEE